MSPVYTCPTCGNQMERDLLLFTSHTEAHVVEELKKKHPNWITSEGYCPKCLEHYKASLKGESVVANIGGNEVTKRQLLAVLGLMVSAGLYATLVWSGVPRIHRLWLAAPIWVTLLGYFQGQRRHCVVLGMKGERNMGGRQETVADEASRKKMRWESLKILMVCDLATAALTAAAYFLP